MRKELIKLVDNGEIRQTVWDDFFDRFDVPMKNRSNFPVEAIYNGDMGNPRGITMKLKLEKIKEIVDVIANLLIGAGFILFQNKLLTLIGIGVIALTIINLVLDIIRTRMKRT